MSSTNPNNIRSELESVMGAKKRIQDEAPASGDAGGEQQEEEESGTVQKKRMMAPQATPNMSAEMASAAAVEFKKKEKQIQKAVAELDGDQPKKSCCVIL